MTATDLVYCPACRGVVGEQCDFCGNARLILASRAATWREQYTDLAGGALLRAVRERLGTGRFEIAGYGNSTRNGAYLFVQWWRWYLNAGMSDPRGTFTADEAGNPFPDLDSALRYILRYEDEADRRDAEGENER